MPSAIVAIIVIVIVAVTVQTKEDPLYHPDEDESFGMQCLIKINKGKGIHHSLLQSAVGCSCHTSPYLLPSPSYHTCCCQGSGGHKLTLESVIIIINVIVKL